MNLEYEWSSLGGLALIGSCSLPSSPDGQQAGDKMAQQAALARATDRGGCLGIFAVRGRWFRERALGAGGRGTAGFGEALTTAYLSQPHTDVWRPLPGYRSRGAWRRFDSVALELCNGFPWLCRDSPPLLMMGLLGSVRGTGAEPRQAPHHAQAGTVSPAVGAAVLVRVPRTCRDGLVWSQGRAPGTRFRCWRLHT